MKRWTNGTVEKFIGTRKKAGKNFEPAEYIIKSQKSALANCREYVALQEQSKTKKQTLLDNNNYANVRKIPICRKKYQNVVVV